VGPGNHVLEGSPDPPVGRDNFEEQRMVICGKMTEQIETVWIVGSDGSRNHVLDGVQIDDGTGNFKGETGGPL